MTKSKINLCDECEFANRSKIAKLESEHSKLKALFAVVRTDLALEKSENAELKRKLEECHDWIGDLRVRMWRTPKSDSKKVKA